MNLAARLSLACGFASLSVEILWVRLYGFAKLTTPAAFGIVLAMYLIGIALGAAAGAKACRRASSDGQLWRWSVAAVLLSALLTPTLPAVFSKMSAGGIQNPLLDLAFIGTASAVLSFVFPIAHHLGTRGQAAGRGRHFARVYAANVFGAALGPLVTGYVLLDHVSLQNAFLILALLQALTAALLARALRLPWWSGGGAAGLSLGLVALGFWLGAPDEHWMLRQFMQIGRQAKTVVENRHGVVTIFQANRDSDMVYGGNVYDGSTNLDLERNSNGLHRPLLLAALQPQPRRVLVMGLSIGSWLALVREFPRVESIDVIEINPGYLEAIAAYPPQAQALRDPRVHLAIDDARSWLRRNPQRRYDLIVMNTTFHWRANASLLLSEEMLRLTRSHMAEGAVLAFNATGSPDAFYTAARVFPHAYRYDSFVYAADFDFRPRKDAPEALALYQGMRMADKPLFPTGSAKPAAYLSQPFHTIANDQVSAKHPLESITDGNMVPEFRRGRPLYEWTDLLFLRSVL